MGAATGPLIESGDGVDTVLNSCAEEPYSMSPAWWYGVMSTKLDWTWLCIWIRNGFETRSALD
jgi:hypothetical protein